MKCQKCGAKMVSGHLYCDICGAEFQIVPDFEPEIEKSIAESLSDISETMEHDGSKKKDNITTLLQKNKVPSFSVILGIVFIVSLFVYFGYSKYSNSPTYQEKVALEAIQKGDYYQAAQIYENIRKTNSNDAYWYIKEAEILLKMQKEDSSYHLAQTALNLDKNTQYAYSFLLDYLKEKEQYLDMKHILDQCPYSEILTEYKEYCCTIPSINYASGSYDEALEISFEKGYDGTIYYTLEDSIPTTSSSKYELPIKLGNGVHRLQVIYENKFGILSDTVVFQYEISSEIPMSPVVNITSGKYSNAQLITVNVEKGTRVFYTTDLSQPTTDSQEYVSPIPMPLGESRFSFIAISENGIASSVTHRNYMLNMKTNLSLEEAEVKLVQKLISTNHILDQNGAVSGRYGVFRYFYKYSICEADCNYYVFEEHYMENQINNPLQHFYAVDVLYGQVYKLIPDGNGNFTRIEF